MQPERGQGTQLQDLNEKMIAESEKEVIIQHFREWGLCEVAAVQFAEDDDDDEEQKTQWFLNMLSVTHEQRQMIAPVMRWATGAGRKSRNCVNVDGKVTASVEPQVREHL